MGAQVLEYNKFYGCRELIIGFDPVDQVGVDHIPVADPASQFFAAIPEFGNFSSGHVVAGVDRHAIQTKLMVADTAQMIARPFIG